MRRSGKFGVGWLLLACWGTALAAPGDASPRVLPPERWVDVHAQVAGNGSAGHPFRALSSALAPNARIHLAKGEYRGPFVLPPNVTLEGAEGVVLFVDGGGAVVTAQAGAVLDHLSIRGGARGLLASGGMLVARACTFSAGSVANSVGLDVRGAQVHLDHVRFAGSYHRALFVERGSATLRDGAIDGAATGISVRGGKAKVTNSRIDHGAGPGIFAGAEVRISRVRIDDHAYGVLTGAGAVVRADHLTVRNAARAGLAFVKSRAYLRDVELDSSGSFGGIQVVSATVEARDLLIRGSGGSGVSMRGGLVRLRSARISAVNDPSGVEGNGLLVRHGRLILGRVEVRDVSGVGLWAGAGSHVHFHVLEIHGSGGGILAEQDAQVEGTRLEVTHSHGPPRIVLGHARIQVRSVSHVEPHPRSP